MENKVLVETSARHVHVSEATLKVLFGENAELTVKKMLSQPGQYASEQRVDLVGPKKTIANVSPADMNVLLIYLQMKVCFLNQK